MNQLHQACSSFVSYLCLGLSIFAAGCAARDEPPAGGEDTAESPSDLYVLSTSIWPSASIPVCWENGTAATAAAQGWTQAAVQAAWPAVSGVSLTGWGNCVPGAKGIRILIEDSGPLTLELGRNLDGLVNGMHLNFTFNNWSQTCIGTPPERSTQ